MSLRFTAILAIAAQTLALADPVITAAAQLAPRSVDPLLVGYISENGGYSDVRSCDYSETISTSGSFVQCCPTTGACPFYTACSSNTLLAASTTVACDVSTTLTCNTALVLPTAGAASAGSYLACWQKTLGSSPFTIVQDIQGASAAAPTTSAVSAGTSSSSRTSAATSSARTTQSTTLGSSSTSHSVSSSASATSATQNAAVAGDTIFSGGLMGLAAVFAQILL